MTLEEIENSTSHARDLLQAIQSLRPQFLKRPNAAVNRTSPAAQPLVVYIDGIRQGGIETLRSISATGALEVRYLDPVASRSTFGPTASGGALLVKLLTTERTPPGD